MHPFGSRTTPRSRGERNQHFVSPARARGRGRSRNAGTRQTSPAIANVAGPPSPGTSVNEELTIPVHSTQNDATASIGHIKMDPPRYDITKQTINLARIALIFFGPCTDILRDILKAYKPPGSLSQHVEAFFNVYPHLKPLISKTQHDIIFTNNYKKFDISLLYFLLRNICSIKEHNGRWGFEPPPADTSLAAWIERLRLKRNTYHGHFADFSISDNEFNDIWDNLNSILKNLEGKTNIQFTRNYSQEILRLKTVEMGTKYAEYYCKKLLVVEQLAESVDELKRRVKMLENAKYPFAVKDILKWTEDDENFLETRNFSAMYEQVLSKPFVMFVGVPGSGKTATARHIALKLQKEDYDILSIKDIKDIETYCDTDKSQVFVIDDVLGKFSLDMKAYDLISRYKDSLLDATRNKTKVLLTCRLQVFRNHKLLEFFLCKKDHVVKLSSDENVLTENDKCSMLELYGIERDKLPSTDPAAALNMFPLSCKLASTRRSKISLEVFISPTCCILEELDGLKIRSAKQYASLVLLVANQNKLSEDIFDNEHNADRELMFVRRKEEFLRACKVSPQTESFEIMDALLEMEGTYTMSCCDVFTFIHESLFEIVAFHFGQHCPNLMLRYMRSDYIANYITVGIESFADEGNGNNYDLRIRLDKSLYKSLAERLYKDVEDGEWCCVFGNFALKDQSVLSFFIELMKEKKYEDLYRVFLSEIEENKRRCIEYELDKNDKESNLINIVNLLYERGNQRAICWVIYYGHNEILKYLLDQILKDKEGVVDDLYGNPCGVQGDTFNEESANDDKDSANDVEESANDNDDNNDSADDNGDLDSDTKKIKNEQHRLILLSSLSGDMETSDIVIRNILESTFGKRTTCRTITYPGISYSCTIKRENGGWKLENKLLTGNYTTNFAEYHSELWK